jgi:protein-disulfide isomerase-like protein with CxxC motif
VSLPAFSLLYDYRCPFARIVHGHVLAAQRAGLELTVTFEPYTLSQGHVPDGEPAIWDSPGADAALVALEASVVVRDHFSGQFAAVHAGLFEARHAEGIALSTRNQVAGVLEACDLDPGEVFALVDQGSARRHIRDAWIHYHDDLDVFGVPTFVFGDADAVFLRLMEPSADDAASAALVEQLVRTMALQPTINELKHTRLSA